MSFVISLWTHLFLYLGFFLFSGNKFLSTSAGSNAVNLEVSMDSSETEDTAAENPNSDKKAQSGDKNPEISAAEFSKKFGVKKEWNDLVKNLSETSNMSSKFKESYDEINHNSGAKDSYIYRKRHYEDLVVKEVFPTLQTIDKPFEQIIQDAPKTLEKYNERNEIIKKFRKYTKGEISENRPVVSITQKGKQGQTPLQFPKSDREKYFNSVLKETKEAQLYDFTKRYMNFDPDKGDLPVAVRELYYDNLQRIVYPFSGDMTYMYVDYFDENLNKEDFLKNSLYQISRLKNTKTQTELLFALHDIYEIQQRAWQHFFDFENIYKNISEEKKSQIRVETLRRIVERYKPVLEKKNIHNYKDAVQVYSKKRGEILEYILDHTPENYRSLDARFEMARLHWDQGTILGNDNEKKEALEIWRSIPSQTNNKDFLNSEALEKLRPLITSFDRNQNMNLVEGPIQSVLQQRQSKRLTDKIKREEKILYPR